MTAHGSGGAAAPPRLSRDGVAGLIGLVGSLILLGATRGIPTPALVPIGPAFYPRILFVVSAMLSVALIVQDLRRLRTPSTPAAKTRYRLVVIAFAVFILYVALLPLLGYRIATFAFVAALHAALDPPRGRGGWLLVGGGALATTVATYLVFERYLSVLLPRGAWTGF